MKKQKNRIFFSQPPFTDLSGPDLEIFGPKFEKKLAHTLGFTLGVVSEV